MKTKKTNAMRLLEKMGIPYTPHEYENEGEPKSGVEVAGELGVDPGRIFKTLVAQAEKEVFVFVIPADCELDLKKAAQAAGVKKIDMLPVKEITAMTGYQRGGCSPFGMKKAYPAFVDASARVHDAIYVSAGVFGRQIELSPQDLVRGIHARFATLCKAD